jgi:molybdate transport system permease protein
MDWQSIFLTLKLATCTTLILGLVGLPLAWWLSRTAFRGRFLVETVLALPLVLPPTVLGFYVLLTLGPRGPLGQVYASLTDGGTLPFSFAGILIGSVLYNIPFSVRPFTAAFSVVDRRMLEASHCLGVPPLATFFRVVLPLSRTGILAGVALTFAHAVGEFGVVMMVGGNIDGVTRTAAISIYDDVQALQYDRAGNTALLMLAFSFVVLAVTGLLNRRHAL